MADDAQDRRLPASERKIRKARTEGQVARSRDLSHLAALGVGGAIVVALAPRWLGWMRELLAGGLRFDAALLAHPASMTERLGELATKMMTLVLPLGAAMVLVAVGAGVLAGGWNFTTQPLQPNLGKANPIAGLGRMLSKQQLVDTMKACGLALLMGAIGAFYLKATLPDFAALIAQPLPAAMGSAATLVLDGLVLLMLALALFALVDVPLQRQLLLRRLRMTVEEAKKEHKDVEGNTEVKAKMRAKMRELANRRMVAAVPQADLVVMNPTHFAVALKYDEATMAAPRVVAKGQDLLAFKIRDAAKGANVPVLQAPPLARALFRHAEVDQEIPAALFGAVAQVLAWVYQLRAAMAAGRYVDLPAPNVVVPPGMDPAASRVEPEL
jgi:flagellar biosynthetic protein FlhB